MYRAANFYHQNPEINSRQHYMECLKHNYDVILKKGAEQNPIPQKEQGKRGKIRTLIDRLQKYKAEVCRFTENPLVPFTNNQAERALRMVKMKSKVTGTFRSEQGAKDFLTIKSFLSNAAKAGSTAFQALLSLFQGQFILGD
ncbi:MAG: transposase [Oscillospiraceae bacterium]|nr:transposase [Oscillospiraceae bacterium]